MYINKKGVFGLNCLVHVMLLAAQTIVHGGLLQCQTAIAMSLLKDLFGVRLLSQKKGG